MNTPAGIMNNNHLSERFSGLAKTVCPLDCPDSCSLIVKVEKGKIISLQGDPDHPYTKGVICRKMKKYPHRMYSSERIQFPLKRKGAKGSGDFERITWEKAYNILVEKIEETVRKYGGEAILPFAYAGNMGAVNRFAGYPLFNKLGTSRQLETICSSAAGAGWRSQCGNIPGCPPEVAQEADVIVIWGSNTKVTNMHFWPYVARAKKKGAFIVVIDPYRNITAKAADLHIPVKPGGDSALALVVLKRLIEQGAVDESFINSSTTGFQTLAEYLRDTPRKSFVEQCGVSENQIAEFADSIGKNKKVFMRLGIGMTRNKRAALSIRSIASLAAALGLFDGKAGRGVLLTSGAFKGNSDELTWPGLAAHDTRILNMVQLGNSLHGNSPPVRLLFVYNANPLSVAPDSSLVRSAMLNKELFTVVHEQVMTPTAQYGDLVLPATTFLENMDLNTAYGHFFMSVSHPAVKPLAETKSNFDFFNELAAKLGFDDPPFVQTIEERISKYLSTMEGLPPGATINDCIGKPVLSTRHSSGLPFFTPEKPFSFCAAANSVDYGIARLESGGEFDDADYISRFPLKLITPPHIDLLNSTFGERYINTPGEVLIHPIDAKQYDVEDGEMVTIENHRGWTRRVVRISDETQSGLLVAEGVYWQSGSTPTAINDLTSQKLTDLGEGGTFHESRVKLTSDQ